MARRNKSIFEKLTGSIATDEEELELDAYDEERDEDWISAENEDAQLTVDVYQTGDSIVIKTLVAGVKPEDIDVSITRETVTIRGSRESASSSSDDNYFHQELYWGTFSRTILLPEEVNVEEAEASQKDGLLVIKLPKIDKKQQTRLKIAKR